MTDRQGTADAPRSGRVAAGDWPVVPGYEVLGELGRGGMGVVYRARQVSLNRLVALKLIRDGALAGPQQRARFRIEAEAAARMRHPNIVAIHDVGEHQGRPYFAMELVDGPSLEQYLAGRPQPVRAAAELLHTLAIAVAHAHAQNVVHRDLKPANVLLESVVHGPWSVVKDGGESVVRGPSSVVKDRNSAGVLSLTTDHGPRTTDSPPSLTTDHGPRTTDFCPKITDFGLAKRLDSDSTALTQEGAVVGTADYMSPEQAAGQGHAIGPTADVYALGAILYETLIGRPPFVGESWQQTLEQVRHDEPISPSRLRPDLPPELETVCLKCLEKDPARRYGSATELADDLRRFLDDTPVVAVPLSPFERLGRLAARDGYELLGEIGRGPRSTVYRARHGTSPQPVAIKRFAPGVWSRREWEARLRGSADAWSTLAHPHIVPVQRAGWWDDAPYLAMEYVPHGSLAGRHAGQSCPVPEALRLVEQLAEIVSYLHRQGVVHGNLKPSNVLLAADGIPRVCDFRTIGGLHQGPLPADNGEAAGLGYLTPEAIRDISAEPRPYTDIYGLGLILYELLTGRAAFAGTTPAEVLEQVRTQEPVPPSQLNPRVPPAAEACCLRCLRKSPWERYTRAYDLQMRLWRLRAKPDVDRRRDYVQPR